MCDNPARQYDPAISGRFVVWTDERNDKGDIYGADLSDLGNIREFAVAKELGAQQQATIDGPLVAYANSSVLDSGIKLACMTRRYGVLSVDLPTVWAGVTPVLDGTSLFWLTSAYGAAQGLTLDLGYSVFDGRVENARTGERYDYLQHAVAFAADGDEIVVPPGVYDERVDFVGKPITIRSTDPSDPAVVAATIRRSLSSTVVFASDEDANSVLAGFTLTGANEGIRCCDAAPTVTRCAIVANDDAGVRLFGQSNPMITHCRIVANGAAGIEMSTVSEGRAVKQNSATVCNCLIAANLGQGVHGGKPTVLNCTIAENSSHGVDAYLPVVTNSIVYFNNLPSGTQIKSARAVVAYSDVQDGWEGDGNIDADPSFVSLGEWFDGAWTAGDYHLQSQGWRWDGGRDSWVSDDVTSPCIDAGDPTCDLLDEPVITPQGDDAVNTCIDMGVYGGTAEASLAPNSP